jgi:hypothetical protein
LNPSYLYKIWQRDFGFEHSRYLSEYLI